MTSSSTRRSTSMALAGVGLVATLTLGALSSASAATVIDGPIDLGTAATYGVLGSSTVTNTGPTIVNGDLGLSPGTSITGFGGAPDGVVNGTVHATDAAAAQAQSDTTTAYNVAASLTPTTTGIGELNGLSLSPGVYTGGALALADNGALTLAGSANSVWVFQAASTLTIGSATRITITGGASACNVFWQVGSSATIGTAAQFQGTVLAQQSITATTSATIAGRLLARNAAVTLDTNTITAPTGCAPPAAPVQTVAPTITSAAPGDATTGTPYSHTVTASGTPAPAFTVSSGALPAGLTLDGTSGAISGTPLAAGSSTFSITASNGTAPDATLSYTLTAAPAAVTPTPTPSPTPTVTPTPTPSPTATVRPTATQTPTAPAGRQPVGGGTGAGFGAGSGSGTAVKTLAETGSDATPIIVFGSLALLAGVALVTIVGIRRRHPRPGNH